jgi:hypothetical protein
MDGVAPKFGELCAPAVSLAPIQQRIRPPDVATPDSDQGEKERATKELVFMIRKLSRRQFIRSSALGGASLLASGAVLPAVAAQSGDSDRAHGERDLKHAITIENERVSISVDSRSGDIIGLSNKRSGREYIAATEWAKAFRLNVPIPRRITGFNADYSANSFDSWLQSNCTIIRGRDAKSQSLTISYPELKSEAGTFSIGVNYTIRLEDGSDEARLHLQIENRSQFKISEVFFPWISGVGEIENRSTDAFAAPSMIYRGADLRNHFNAEANWEEYPFLLDTPKWPDGYSLAMPWMNYGGESEGLYFASLTRTGIQHRLMVQDYGAAQHPILSFAWAFESYIGPGDSWRSPELVVSPHQGDWHAAADKYRASLDGWYRKADTPLEFRRALGTFNSFFTKRDFMQIAELAEDIRKYGIQHLIMWNFGDYYPKVLEPDDLSVDPPRLGQFAAQWGGPARLLAANQKARDLGVSTGIIFSQRLWNKATLTRELQGLAEEWAIRRESGDPIWESWDHQHFGAARWSNRQQSFGQLDYVMCSAVEGYRELAVRNVRGVLQQGGYSMMFYDQVVEGNLCFSAKHNHNDVSAPSIATPGFAEELRAGMKLDNPAAVLIGEGWEILASQFLDSGWVWRMPPNPEVLQYTLPWVINTSAVPIDIGLANKYVILGLRLAIVAGGLENGKNLSDFPEFAAHIRRLTEFRKRTEQLWVEGTFRDDIGLRASGAFAKVYETDQRIAIMSANLTAGALTLQFDLDGSRFDIEPALYSLISSRGTSEVKIAARKGSTLVGSAPLEPFELAAIVFEKRKPG